MPQSKVLTIVVPVFNVAPYLDDLLDSLLPQLNERCECIFVDDCSTDGSLDHLRSRASNHACVRILTKNQNGGLSEARNMGADAAAGSHIWFLDSDDLAANGAVEKVMQWIDSGNGAVLAFDYVEMRQTFTISGGAGLEPAGLPASDAAGVTVLSQKQYSVVPARHLAAKAVTKKRFEILEAILTDDRFYAWAYVVPRALNGSLRFPAGRHFEDVSVTPYWMLAAGGVFYLDEPLVVYRRRYGSIVSKPNPSKAIELAEAFGSLVMGASPPITPDNDDERELLAAIWMRKVLAGATLLWEMRGFRDAGLRGSLRRQIKALNHFAGSRRNRIASYGITSRQAMAWRLLCWEPRLFLLAMTVSRLLRRTHATS